MLLTNTCKFKIDEITYSKRAIEQLMTLVKIYLYFRILTFLSIAG